MKDKLYTVGRLTSNEVRDLDGSDAEIRRAAPE